MPALSIDQALQVAMQLHQQQKLGEAENLYRQILAASPDQSDALNYLGVLVYQTGRAADAIPLFQRAVKTRPNYAQAFFNLANALNATGQPRLAHAAFCQAIAVEPQWVEAHQGLITSLLSEGETASALTAAQSAILVLPNSPAILCQLGNALRANEKRAEAIVAYEQAISLDPNSAAAFNELGLVMEIQGKPREAIDAYRRAIAIDPNFTDAHFRLSMQRLLLGDMPGGWHEYEWRLKLTGPGGYWQPPDPQWDGSNLTGRTILLHREQGFGDTLQFIRYAPLVAAAGGRVLLVCAPEQLRLLQSMKDIAAFFIPNQPLPKFDVQCPLMSLPAVLNTTLASIPNAVPYLHADPSDVGRWKDKLQADPSHRKVGLVWAGRPTHPNDANRSIPFAQLAPLAQVPNVTFFSLQKGDWSRRMASPLKLIDHTEAMSDFADTAACIENLDLVISVDTSVVHLAGALGKPVWTLLPHQPEWRWLLDRDDSPWYPTMRLFRQPAPGDWGSVIQQVKQALM